MAKYGEITYWLEIPVIVNYELCPAERATRDYPGCPKHIIVDFIKYPDEQELGKLVDAEADRIKEACWEDAGE